MHTWYVPHPYGILPKGNRVLAKQREHAERVAALAAETVNAGGAAAVATSNLNKANARRKLSELADAEVESSEDELARRIGPTFAAIFAHPAMKDDDSASLELLFTSLEFLDAPSLCRLAATSTAWFALANVAEIWKRLFHALACPQRRENRGVRRPLRFVHDWKTTVIREFWSDPATSSFAHTPRRFPGRALYNDALFQAWLCTTMPPDFMLKPKKATVATAVDLEEEDGDADAATGQPTRVDFTKRAMAGNARLPQYTSKFRPVPKVFRPSVDEFRERFEAPNLPCVITGVATEWPIFQELNGDFSNLGKKADLLFPRRKIDVDPASVVDSRTFRCESLDMTAEGYVTYALAQQDERPIYLFDAEFSALMNDDDKMWSVPEYFARDDLFRALGADRPKFRWLIAGPTRGGSSFHVDPNFTTAWNACLTGRKRWLMFPPQHIPPGVFPSADMRDVTTPVSITEWFLNFYEEAQVKLSGVGYEVICDPGEIVFVPYGWWHTVLNLGDSVALTQNYVSRCNLHKVLRFLKHMPNSISGINEDADDVDEAALVQKRRGFFDKFVHALQAASPPLVPDELLRGVLEGIDGEEDTRKRKRLEREQREKIELLRGDDGDSGFSFSF